MSIFHQIVKSESSLEKFYKDHFERKDNKFGNPYEILLKIENALAKPIVKISTNIDLEWERILKDESEKQKQNQTEEGQAIKAHHFYTQSKYFDFTGEQKIADDILYQIHGSLNKINRTIITTEDYVRNYRDEKGLKGFLAKLFKEYVVLFIGSGIQEFEILEHCLIESQNKHFALIGTQLGEDNLFRIQRGYFDGINIKAIRYYLDFQGYDRLLIVLQSWVNEIAAIKKKTFYDEIRLIDEVM
jgi:hypothetical protein